MISIIDVGSGNIDSFVSAYERLGIQAEVVTERTKLLKAKKIILPGVGSFDSFMTKLNYSGLKETLEDLVLNKQVPIMGVCVGMQVLGRKSEEGRLQGLGWIKGENKKFEGSGNYPAPAMGWNEISPSSSPENILLNDIDLKRGFYFLHSYYFKEEESFDHKISSYHGLDFTCGFRKENIFGIQFHPEKSHQNGIQLLKNFTDVSL